MQCQRNQNERIRHWSQRHQPVQQIVSLTYAAPLNHQPVSKVKELLQKLLEAQTMMDDDKVFLYAVYYAQ